MVGTVASRYSVSCSTPCYGVSSLTVIAEKLRAKGFRGIRGCKRSAGATAHRSRLACLLAGAVAHTGIVGDAYQAYARVYHSVQNCQALTDCA